MTFELYKEAGSGPAVIFNHGTLMDYTMFDPQLAFLAANGYRAISQNSRVLLGKARQDEFVLDQFVDNPAAADETFGFHAQQAAEKLLKAALAAGGVVPPRTHRLGDLLDLAHDRGLSVPEEFDDLHRLTPFAVDYRYEFFAEEADKPLDRPAVLEQVRRLRGWVVARLNADEKSGHG